MIVQQMVHGVESITVGQAHNIWDDEPGKRPVYSRSIVIEDANGNIFTITVFSEKADAVEVVGAEQLETV